MEFKYFHDTEKQTVYRMLTQAIIIEQRDTRNKKNSGWSLRMQIELTRADNSLVNNHWKYPCGEFPQQYFDARYSKESALAYFYERYTPRCQEIDCATYRTLMIEYEAKARANIGS